MSAVPELRFPEFTGSLPKDRVGHLATVKTGSRDTQNRVSDGPYPFFVRSDNIERIDSFALDKEAVLTSGDGVGVGKNFHYIDGKFDYHQRVYAIYDFSCQLSGSYFYHYFSSRFYQHVMRQSAKNSVDSVRMSMITDMHVPVPTLPEQKKIAAFLGAVDDKIDALRRKHDALKQFKAGLMQKLFSQELRFKRDDGSDYPDWEEKRLGELTSWSSGGTPSKSFDGYWNGDIPWISAASMHADYVSNSPVKITKIGLKAGSKLAPANAILLLVRGSMLFNRIPICLTKLPVAFNQDVKCLQLKSGVTARFLFYSLKAQEHQIRSMVSGTGIGAGKLDTPQMKMLPIYLPEPDEQKKIADCLAAVDAKIEAVAGQIAHMEAFKAGLLQKMFV